MNQNNQAEQKGLGYLFSPARRLSEPGFSKLDIVLRDIPTEQHFDPSYVRVIVAQEKGPEYWTVEHPWAGEKSLHICAGSVDIGDRKNKRVEVFTFGGQLEIEVHEDWTSVIINSPAPILIMRAQETISSLVAQEAEILLAERSAAMGAHVGEYESRQVNAEPWVLYQAVIHAIQERIENMPRRDNELWLHFRHTLKEEIRFFDESGQPSARLNLDEVL